MAYKIAIVTPTNMFINASVLFLWTLSSVWTSKSNICWGSLHFLMHSVSNRHLWQVSQMQWYNHEQKNNGNIHTLHVNFAPEIYYTIYGHTDVKYTVTGYCQAEFLLYCPSPIIKLGWLSVATSVLYRSNISLQELTAQNPNFISGYA